MKKIKAVVLKHVTKLTNSEMKNVRGGYDPMYPTSCTVKCPVGSASIDCSYLSGAYCDIVSGAGTLGVRCFYENRPYGELKECIEPEFK